MNQDNSDPPSQVSQAMAELVVWRNASFDKQDSSIWMDRLEEHNHSGLTLEAARRFGEDEALQDTPVTLSNFLRVVKQVRSERIESARDRFPQPPSGITDEQYRAWVKYRNEAAVMGGSPEQIDQAARYAIGASPRPAISNRPAPKPYLPSAPSDQQ